MKFTSNVLFELARVIGLTVPGPVDNNIDIPAQLQPTIELQSPLDSPNLNGTGIVNLQSVHTSSFISFTAGATQDNLLMTLGHGLWRFNIMGALTTNYIATVGQFDANIRLTYNGGTVYLLGMNAAGASASAVAQFAQRTMEVLIPIDGALVRAFAQGNAAGNSLFSAFDVMATKLL